MREDRRNLAAAISVVERLLDLVRRQAESGRLLAVDIDRELRIADLQIGGHVAQHRETAHPLQHFRRLGVKRGQVARLQRILIGGARGAAAIQVEVLDRIENRGHAGDRIGLAAQARDDRGDFATLLLRLQRNENLALIGAARADVRRHGFHRRVVHQDLHNLLLLVHHGLDADVRRSLGRAREVACVLDGEEALRDPGEHQDAADECRERQGQHNKPEAKNEIEGPAVGVGDAVEHVIDGAREQARLRMMVDRLQDAGAEHRRQRQRDEARDKNGAGDHDREFAEHAAHHAAHQQHWNEHGDQRQRDRQNGEADFLRALQRRIERLHAVLDVTHDVFEHDDGVVDDEANRQCDRQQRDIVDRIAKHIHEGAGADQRHGQGQSRDDRRRNGLQEEEDHEHDKRDRQAKREFDVFHGFADRARTVVQHEGLHGRRQLRLIGRQLALDRVDDLHSVGVRLTEHGEQDGAILVLPGGDLVVLDAVINFRDFAQPHRRAVAPGDDEIAIAFGVFDLAGGRQRDVLAGAAQRADGRR